MNIEVIEFLECYEDAKQCKDSTYVVFNEDEWIMEYSNGKSISLYDDLLLMHFSQEEDDLICNGCGEIHNHCILLELTNYIIESMINQVDEGASYSDVIAYFEEWNHLGRKYENSCMICSDIWDLWMSVAVINEKEKE